MMIKASGRSALMVVTGLFVCFAGVSYTTAAIRSRQFEIGKRNGAQVGQARVRATGSAMRIANTSGPRKNLLPSKRLTRKRSPMPRRDAGLASALEWPTPTHGSTRIAAHRHRQGDDRTRQRNPAGPGVTSRPTTSRPTRRRPPPARSSPPDQLNDVDRTLQEAKPPAQVQAGAPPSQTVAMATTAIKAGPPAASGRRQQ